MKQNFLLLFIICNVFFIFSCTKNAVKKNVEMEKVMLDVFVDLTGEEIRKTIVSKAVKQFGVEYPHVVLNVMYDSGASYKNRLIEMSATDTLPDIMYLWHDEMEIDFLLEGEKIKNLSNMFKPYQDEFFDVAVKQHIDTKSLYVVPDYINTPVIVYANMSLLEKMNMAPAMTYEELILQGKIIREYGKTPILMDTTDSYKMRMSLLSLFLLRFNKTSWIFDRKYQWSPYADGLLETLENLNAIYSSNLLPRKNEIYNRDEVLEKFISGEATYFIDTSVESKYTYFETFDLTNKNIQVILFPEFSHQMQSTQSLPIIIGRGFGMKNKLEKEKEEAAKNWILFYAGKQGAVIKQKYNIRNISYKDNFVRLKQDNILQATLHTFLNNKADLHHLHVELDDEKVNALYQLTNKMIEKTLTPYEVLIAFSVLY